MIYVLYVIPWLFIAAALAVAVATAAHAQPGEPPVSRSVAAAAAHAMGFVRSIPHRLRSRGRFREFDRALADFRRNAPVCQISTLDDTAGRLRDHR